jgi:hypothetical protein
VSNRPLFSAFFTSMAMPSVFLKKSYMFFACVMSSAVNFYLMSAAAFIRRTISKMCDRAIV